MKSTNKQTNVCAETVRRDNVERKNYIEMISLASRMSVKE